MRLDGSDIVAGAVAEFGATLAHLDLDAESFFTTINRNHFESRALHDAGMLVSEAVERHVASVPALAAVRYGTPPGGPAGVVELSDDDKAAIRARFTAVLDADVTRVHAVAWEQFGSVVERMSHGVLERVALLVCEGSGS